MIRWWPCISYWIRQVCSLQILDLLKLQLSIPAEENILIKNIIFSVFSNFKNEWKLKRNKIFDAASFQLILFVFFSTKWHHCRQNKCHFNCIINTGKRNSKMNRLSSSKLSYQFSYHYPKMKAIASTSIQ